MIESSFFNQKIWLQRTKNIGLYGILALGIIVSVPIILASLYGLITIPLLIIGFNYANKKRDLQQQRKTKLFFVFATWISAILAGAIGLLLILAASYCGGWIPFFMALGCIVIQAKTLAALTYLATVVSFIPIFHKICAHLLPVIKNKISAYRLLNNKNTVIKSVCDNNIDIDYNLKAQKNITMQDDETQTETTKTEINQTETDFSKPESGPESGNGASTPLYPQ